MDEQIRQVLQWGKERGLQAGSDLKPQLTKLMEELGEIAAGVARGDNDRIVDGVGDLLVVLINFGAIHSKDLEISPDEYLFYALSVAWHQIKDRKGQTVSGVFIKENE